ncbi:zinc ABC transporter substrate-binding protein [Candidatus Roizmanbacteria bacterium]|nr:zinc ABC transporter substrate-binding protein [Candidatus Roizmanbacteria bacterium]
MNSNKKYIKNVLIAFLIGLLLLIVFRRVLIKRPTPEAPANTKMKVATSFYPLYFFTSQIGGEQVEIVNVTPSGIEPHDYEPTPQNIIDIRSSKLFIFNGNGLDPWADKIQDEVKRKGVVTIKMSDHAVSPDENDPHFWLDPILVQKQIDAITDALIKIDPQNEAKYKIDSKTFKNRLTKLDEDYKEGLFSCKLREIIVSHRAFNYLAKRYNLTTFYISGLSPDEEPSPNRIAEIANIARQKGIGYIFFETLVSPKLSETVASEIGAKTLVLNPIEGLTEEDMNSGRDYFMLMKQNLANLKMALSCI